MSAQREISITIRVSSDAERELKARAEAAGVDLITYISVLLEQITKRPRRLEEISGPVAAEFETSGMTDDELGDLLEKAKHAMRAERRARRTHQAVSPA